MKFCLDVIRNIQKNQVIYLGYLKKSEAKTLLFSDHYPPENTRLGYQRPPDKKRAQSFGKYLKENSASFTTPVLLNARVPIKYEEDRSGKGNILIPDENCVAIIDGQHRTLGITEFYEDDIDIPFMLFDNLNCELEQELFITINREQKKVSMSHVQFIGRQNDEYSQIAVKLESDKNSPWYQRVNLVGARGTKRPVSLQSLRSALVELLQSGEIKVLPIDQKYNIARDFWNVVSEVWPHSWEAKKSSLLTKALGTLALSKLGGFLIPKCLENKNTILDQKKVYEYLKKAKNVNWQSDGDFKGFSGRHGADLVKNELDALIFKDISDEN